MKTKDSQMVSDEIRDFLDHNADPAASAKEQLPLESMDDFSTLPLSYEKIHATMLERVEDLFVLTSKYNRHSEKYLEALNVLEKGINCLGSVCITRIVLKKNGRELPMLHQLSTHKLYGMACFNYLKINAAIEEDMKNKGEFSMKLMNTLIRWNHVLEKLQSTELKILQINSGEICATNYFRRAWLFSEKSHNRRNTMIQNEVPVYRETTAYPIDFEAVRECVRDSRTKRAAVKTASAPAVSAEAGKNDKNTLQPSEEAAPEPPKKEIPVSVEDGTVDKNNQQPSEEAASDTLKKEDPVLAIEIENGFRANLKVSDVKKFLGDQAFCRARPDVEKRMREFLTELDSS